MDVGAFHFETENETISLPRKYIVISQSMAA
jgi:hypothetical protein